MSKRAWHFGDPAELAEESARHRAEEKLEVRARQPLPDNPLAAGPAPGSTAGSILGPASTAAPWPRLPERALANPRRLRTPGRQRPAFLRQLERCTSVVEAAARGGINRATLYRWRTDIPAFAEKWARAIMRQSEDVNVNIVLRANHGDVRPVFHRGKRVGEQQRFNDRLQIHLQNRLDAERRRAEERAERRALAELKARPIDEAALAARLLALIERRETSHSVSHAPTPEAPDSANANKGLDKAA